MAVPAGEAAMSEDDLVKMVVRGLDAGLTPDQIIRLGKNTTADS